MKTISTLAVVSFVAAMLLSACAMKQFPTDPGIKKHYLLEIRDEPIKVQDLNFIEDVNAVPEMREAYRCLEFDIISWQPYKIKFVAEVPAKQCNLTGGYAPKDVQRILNWIDDVYLWAKDRKRCIKL